MLKEASGSRARVCTVGVYGTGFRVSGFRGLGVQGFRDLGDLGGLGV